MTAARPPGAKKKSSVHFSLVICFSVGAQLTCYGVDGSDWKQQNDSDVDVPLQRQLDEQSAGVHVNLGEENTHVVWQTGEKSGVIIVHYDVY